MSAANSLDAQIRPITGRWRIIAAVCVLAMLAAFYWWGWGTGIEVAIRDLVADSGANTSGTVTLAGQMRRLAGNLLFTAVAAVAFCTVRRLACGFAFIRPAKAVESASPVGGPVSSHASALRRWWDAGFAYCFCMLAGFAAIDVASAVLGTTFHSYPFGTRYESAWAATIYLINMFFAGPTEELVLLGLTVIGLRWVGSPWWLVGAVAMCLRVPFHLYYGWAAFAIAVWPVLAVLLFRRVGMITPMIVAHGMYDVSTSMTSLTVVFGSNWPLVVSGLIVATPVVWLVATIVARIRDRRGRARAARKGNARRA